MVKYQLIAVAIVFSMAACTTGVQINRGATYQSPMGQFICGPFDLDTRVQVAFGAHGGTLRFIDEVDMTRIDVQEFQPPLDENVLQGSRAELYRDYLNAEILPLVKTAVPNAQLVDTRSAVIGERLVYQSAILMPGKSNAISGDGKPFDGLRVQVQYTNGRYMFTVSINSAVSPEKSRDEQIRTALSYAGFRFKECIFP